MTIGPLSTVQLAHVAREHYVKGKSRVEIAEETGLSRFKVGRMLEEAVEKGIIRFEIVSSPGVDLDLSMQLKQRFGLDHAIAVEVPVDSDAEAQQSLGAAAARLLDELIGPEDVLGLTSGRTLNVMARALTRAPSKQVVQMAGIAGPIQETGLEVIRSLSAFPGVTPWPLYGSLVMSDPQAAEGMLRQPDVRATVERFDAVTVALCAVGSWQPANSLMMVNPALTQQDRESLLARGVVAEVAAMLVTDSGELIPDIEERCIAIREPAFRRIGTRIAIAGGPGKARAIRAVLTAALVTGLVTDVFTARRLLST
ncbi:DNA-binding transcriptional regulator [Micrococcales bacterium 31B]|nr:DNA-binding transcriptional regulator [Micrococcales bacterium 31B]